MSGGLLSLNVDDRVIRLLVTRGSRVLRWASISLKPGIVEDGVVRDREQFLDRFRTLTNSAMLTRSLQGKGLRLSVAGRSAVLRRLQVERVGSQPLKQQVAEACGDAIPVPMEELEWAWRPLRRARRTIDLYCLGLYRSTLATNLSTLRRPKLVPKVVEPKALALARLVGATDALVVDVEDAGLELVVVREGVPDLVRSTRFATGDVSDQQVADIAMAEVDSVTSFYNSSRETAPIPDDAPLYLTGPGANRPMLRWHLAHNAPYRLNPLPNRLRHSPHLPVTDYAVNLGLALGSTSNFWFIPPMGNTRLGINLLPADHQIDARNRKRALLGVAVFASLALAYPLYSNDHAMATELSSRRVELNTMESHLRSRMGHIRRGEELQQAIGEAQGELDRLGQQAQLIRSTSGNFAAMGVALYQAALPDVVLSYVSDDGAISQVRGEAKSFQRALEYVDTVRQFPYFSEVTLDSLSSVGTADSSTLVQFRLTAQR